MAGISRFEKWILLLTAGFVLFTGGYFLAGQHDPEPYTVTAEATPAEPSAPDPAEEEAQSAAQEGERPDSLLEGEVIDVNTADVYDLDRLPGIGEVTLENLRPYVTAGG